MGSAQSYLSPEAAITVVVVAGAIGLGYTQVGSTSHTGSVSSAISGEGAAKKGKKKKQVKGTAAGGDISESGPASKAQLPVEPEPRVVAFPDVIPGQFDTTPAQVSAFESSSPEAAAAKAKKSKKKKGKTSTAETTPQPVSTSVDYLSESSVKAPARPKNTKRPSQTSQPLQSSSTAAVLPSSQYTRPLHLSTTSIDTDGSWTRVGSRRTATSDDKGIHSAEPSTSDAGITTSQTGNSSPAAERTEDEESESFLLQQSSVSRDTGDRSRKTLAEKLLPKPRKTGVDDMLETPDYPVLSRVMRVQPLPTEKPATGFSWGDYEDVRVTTDGGENDADGEDDGWGVVASKRPKRTNLSASASSQSSSHQPKAPESMTKRQRQNAQKKDDQKAAKAVAESERLATLAKHKRELEKVRMAEQFSKSAGKTPSGGMKATVDDKGKLVWE